MSKAQWEFWIDRGGTFTDVVARQPDGGITTHKTAVGEPRNAMSMRRCRASVICWGLTANDPLPRGAISAVKMGTTVATKRAVRAQGRTHIVG